MQLKKLLLKTSLVVVLTGFFLMLVFYKQVPAGRKTAALPPTTIELATQNFKPKNFSELAPVYAQSKNIDAFYKFPHGKFISTFIEAMTWDSYGKGTSFKAYTQKTNAYNNALLTNCNLIASNDIPLISDAIFTNELYFSNCHFSGKNPYQGDDPFSFRDIRFNGLLTFQIIDLDKELKFETCDFEDNVLFYSSLPMKKSIVFHSSNFHKSFYAKSDATRSETVDNDAAPQTNLKSDTSLEFRNCNFNGNLMLSGSDFSNKGVIKLINSNLPDTIDLLNVKADQVSITGVRDSAERMCYLDLLGSKIRSLNLEYINFKLYFPKGTQDDRIDGVYEMLLNQFKNDGFETSYENLDIEYRYQKATRGNFKKDGWLFRELAKWSPNLSENIRAVINSLRFPVMGYILNRAWWNFGYNRVRIIFWSLLIILLFSWYNAYRMKNLQEVFQVDNLDPNNIPADSGLIKIAVLRYWYCLIYTGFVFFKIDFDVKKMDFSSKYMVVLLVQYVVGLICTGFILNLIFGR